MSKPLVLFSHDGGVDDYLSVMLLATFPDVEVLGISVTPADCYIEPAASATRKILDLMGRTDIPVAKSTSRGINPFPRQFRRASFNIDLFPILNETETIKTPEAKEDGQHFIAKTIKEASGPVTLLETGPLTTIADALDIDPSIEEKIERIVWMGGALNVPGNINAVIEGGHDSSAEWNVYWDAISAHKIWQTKIPIVMCPLDICNDVSITREFVLRLAHQRKYPVSDLAGLCYSLVMNQIYYMWDVLTTAYIGRPDLFTTKEWETEIIPTGISQGRTKVTPGGREVLAMDTVDKEAFLDYVVQQWAR
jgi:purine nucleosidase